MTRYRVAFMGRQTGAIGIFYPCVVFVTAENPEDAREAIYATHEPYGPCVVTEVIE